MSLVSPNVIMRVLDRYCGHAYTWTMIDYYRENTRSKKSTGQIIRDIGDQERLKFHAPHLNQLVITIEI